MDANTLNQRNAGAEYPASRSPLRLPRAVLFDLDDTLVYGYDAAAGRDLDIHYESWRTVLAERGNLLRHEQYLRHMKGLDHSGCQAYLEGALGIAGGERVGLAKSRCYRERMLPRYLRLRPGVGQFLQALRARDVWLGIYTNAPRANLDSTYAALGLDAWIPRAQALAIDDLHALGLRAKPEPDGLLHVVRQLKLERGELLYVGDSSADIRAARAAGVAVLVITANYPTAELTDMGATGTFDSYAELRLEDLPGTVGARD